MGFTEEHAPITLQCGCVIDFYPPHDSSCNCEDAMTTCQTGYWFMDQPCKRHEVANE